MTPHLHTQKTLDFTLENRKFIFHHRKWFLLVYYEIFYIYYTTMYRTKCGLSFALINILAYTLCCTLHSRSMLLYVLIGCTKEL